MGNANSGPKRQPNALQLLKGVTRKDRLNPAEPVVPAGEVTVPDGLSPDARQVWDRTAPLCIHMGTLTVADVLAFATLCELQATIEGAAKQKAEPGFSLFLLTSMVDSAGNEHTNVKVHPAIKIEKETASTIRPYYDYFGMTPTGRARIQVPKKEAEPVSKWAGALK